MVSAPSRPPPPQGKFNDAAAAAAVRSSHGSDGACIGGKVWPDVLIPVHGGIYQAEQKEQTLEKNAASSSHRISLKRHSRHFDFGVKLQVLGLDNLSNVPYNVLLSGRSSRWSIYLLMHNP